MPPFSFGPGAGSSTPQAINLLALLQKPAQVISSVFVLVPVGLYTRSTAQDPKGPQYSLTTFIFLHGIVFISPTPYSCFAFK